MSNGKKLPDGSRHIPRRKAGRGRRREPSRAVVYLVTAPGRTGAKLLVASALGSAIAMTLPTGAASAVDSGAENATLTASTSPIPTTGAGGVPGIVIPNPNPVQLPGSTASSGPPVLQPLTSNSPGLGTFVQTGLAPAPSTVPPVDPTTLQNQALPKLGGGFTPNPNVVQFPEQAQNGPVLNVTLIGESWASGNGSDPGNFYYTQSGKLDPSFQSASTPMLQALAQVMAANPGLQVNLIDAAHTGATSATMTMPTDVGTPFQAPSQLSAVPGANLVLAQFGGDDAHVINLITEALAMPDSMAPGYFTNSVLPQFANGTYGNTIAGTLNDVAKLAGGNTSVVVGSYPEPFNLNSIGYTTSWPFTSGLIGANEANMFNQFADLTSQGNQQASNAAAAANPAANFIFANAQGALDGYQPFGASQGLTGLVPSYTYYLRSYHPDEAGETAIANAYLPYVAEAVYNQMALQGYTGTLNVPPIGGTPTFAYEWNSRVDLPLQDQAKLSQNTLAQQVEMGPQYDMFGNPVNPTDPATFQLPQGQFPAAPADQVNAAFEDLQSGSSALSPMQQQLAQQAQQGPQFDQFGAPANLWTALTTQYASPPADWTTPSQGGSGIVPGGGGDPANDVRSGVTIDNGYSGIQIPSGQIPASPFQLNSPNPQPPMQDGPPVNSLQRVASASQAQVQDASDGQDTSGQDTSGQNTGGGAAGNGATQVAAVDPSSAGSTPGSGQAAPAGTSGTDGQPAPAAQSAPQPTYQVAGSYNPTGTSTV